MLLLGAILLLAPPLLPAGLYSIFTLCEWSLGVKWGRAVGMLLLGRSCMTGSRALCERCHPALLFRTVSTVFVVCLHSLVKMFS